MVGHQFPDGIDPYKVPGNLPADCYGVLLMTSCCQTEQVTKKFRHIIIGFVLLMILKIEYLISRPGDYDSTRYELLLRLFLAQPGKRTLNDYFIISKMPNHKTDINNRGGFSSDMIGMNHRYPEAGYKERAEIIKKHEGYTKGLLYFYGHDSAGARRVAK